ncbi:MAG: C40 family peptidase [Rhodocyclaceae bacterium]|nr:C40 family peptidase [Rhodocyclaceae bacterium]
MTVIDLSPVVDAVRAQAATCAPRECCGVVVVARGRLRYMPCRNDYNGDDDTFVLNPEDYAAAEDQGEVIAIAHSHVGLPPFPSMADKVGIEAHGLPWLIVNHPVGTWSVNEPEGYRAPLIGRPFVHGVLDCYALCRDYYRETCALDLPDYPRDDLWWQKPGQNLYLDHFAEAGFVEIDAADLRPHDGILMQAGADRPNHAAIHLGDNLILHHFFGRLSSRDVWGGYWKKCTTHYLRHKSLA